jgi:poly-beta-1,6-N-acetyl-D-glucosamine synthase
LLSVYVAMVCLFLFGWQTTRYFNSNTDTSQFNSIAVIVVCKNEEKKLPSLLHHLQKQTNRNFELVVINDHSTDGTARIAKNVNQHFPIYTFVDAIASGKKSALKQAINATQAELIVTIDADCIPPVQWLDVIVSYYLTHKPDLIIGPVRFLSNNSFWQNLQQLEFLSLVASTAGAAGAKMPIMCNGANLAFKREAWLEAQHHLKDNIASGDDMFLLQRLKQLGKKIAFLKSSQAIVDTYPSKSIKEFLNQRVRWAGKSLSYTDSFTIFVASTVFAVASYQVISLIMTFVYTSLIIYWFAFFLTKLSIDTFFLTRVAYCFGINRFKVFNVSLSLSFIYPFYIFFSFVISLFRSRQQW